MAAALGIAGIDSWASYGQAQVTAGRAHDRQKNWATRGPTYAMKGLRDAGINPILAAGGGLNATSARSVMAQSHPQRTAMSPNAPSERRLLNAQTTNAEQQARHTANLGDISANDARIKQLHADYLNTPEGRRTIADGHVNASLPTSAGGAAIRVGRNIGSSWPSNAFDNFKWAGKEMMNIPTRQIRRLEHERRVESLKRRRKLMGTKPPRKGR